MHRRTNSNYTVSMRDHEHRHIRAQDVEIHSIFYSFLNTIAQTPLADNWALPLQKECVCQMLHHG